MLLLPLDIPNSYIQAVNSTILKFILRKRKDKMKHKVMVLDYDRGGLHAPSIELMVKSL